MAKKTPDWGFESRQQVAVSPRQAICFWRTGKEDAVRHAGAQFLKAGVSIYRGVSKANTCLQLQAMTSTERYLQLTYFAFQRRMLLSFPAGTIHVRRCTSERKWTLAIPSPKVTPRRPKGVPSRPGLGRARPKAAVNVQILCQPHVYWT